MEFNVGDDLKAALSASAMYVSRVFTDTANTPEAIMSKHALIDASAKLGSESHGWEIALIGKNLTNKYTYSSSSNVQSRQATATAAYLQNARSEVVKLPPRRPKSSVRRIRDIR
jgi:iron complex outermembrane receptor protein